MTDDEFIQSQPWLSVARVTPILIITLHSTRGPTTQDLQYQATKNWMQSLGNVGERSDSDSTPLWGSSTNRIIGSDGQMCTAVPDDRYCTYGAGFGDVGSWAVDHYAINIELAQATNDQPFTDATLERCAQVCADLCRQYGIPPVWLDDVDQTAGPVPSGITSHELTDNGTRLRKTDVGKMFPIMAFMDMVKDGMELPERVQERVQALEDRQAEMLLKLDKVLYAIQDLQAALNAVADILILSPGDARAAWEVYQSGQYPRPVWPPIWPP